MPSCYRCEEILLDITPDNLTEISFFGCQNCGCQYAKKQAGSLHDRWQMPLTIVLYDLIYEKEPLERLEQVFKHTKKRKDDYIQILIAHIESELTSPQQNLIDIHEFVYPDEQKLRDFLAVLSERLKHKN